MRIGRYPGDVIGTADSRIRGAVFDWLTEQRNSLGEALPRASLEAFMLDGSRVPLVGPQGIWNPPTASIDHNGRSRPVLGQY